MNAPRLTGLECFAVPPQVSVPESDATVSVADQVMLTCSVGGDPIPDIRWTKNGRPVELSERIVQLLNGSLVIYDSTVRKITVLLKFHFRRTHILKLM